MQSGIIVQHGQVAERDNTVVRCDITAIIGFVPYEKWPDGAQKGDFFEIVLRQEREIWGYELKDLFDTPTRRAVHDFFVNGGRIVHLFAICIEALDELVSPVGLSNTMFQVLDRLRAEEDIGIVLIPMAAP